MPSDFKPIKFKCLNNQTLTGAQISDHEPVFNGGVCTFNLMSIGKDGNNFFKKTETVKEYQARLVKLIAVIKELKEVYGIDVFMFQAAPQLNSPDDPGNTFYNQLRAIKGFEHLVLTPSVSDPSKVESDWVAPIKSKNSANCIIADNSRFTQTLVKKNEYGIKAKIQGKKDNQQIMLLNLQGGSSKQVKNLDWLKGRVNNPGEPIIIGGDFHTTEASNELSNAGIYRRADNFNTYEGLICNATSANHLVLASKDLLEVPRIMDLPTAAAEKLVAEFLIYYKQYRSVSIKTQTMENNESSMAPSCMSFSTSLTHTTNSIITIKHKGVEEAFNTFLKHQEVLNTKMTRVNNGSDGNCMYYSYGISLMYVLRFKGDSGIRKKIFDRLGISSIAVLPETVSDQEKLNNLLNKYQIEPNKDQQFTHDDISTIIEPILGKATRDTAAEETRKQYLAAPRASELFSSAVYGIEHAFIQELNQLNFSTVCSAELNNDFNDPYLTKAEVYKTYGDYSSEMKDGMDQFAKDKAAAFKDKYIAAWNTKKLKLPPAELEGNRLKCNQGVLFNELISQETELFFSQNNNKRLDDYISRLKQNQVFGSAETLLLLNGLVKGERKVKGADGRFSQETQSDIDITFSIYKDGNPDTQQVQVTDMVINNEGDSHWTSYIPPRYWPPNLTPPKPASPSKSDPAALASAAAAAATPPEPKKEDSDKSVAALAKKKDEDPQASSSTAKKPDLADKAGAAATKAKDGEPTSGQPAAATQPKPLVRQPRAGLLGGPGGSTQPKDGSKKEHSGQPVVNPLETLRDHVARATVDYTSYNESVWYSIFHRHGNAGRVRADAFHKEFKEIKNYDEAKEKLIEFLSNDNNNGNTYAHSYRTMLLNQLLAEPRPTLQETSDKFDAQLKEVSAAWGITLDSLKQNI